MDEAAILDCVACLYEAAYDPAVWPKAVETLRGVLGGSSACLVRMGPGRRPGDLVAPSNDPAFQDRYIAEFLSEPNIIEETVARMPVGSVYADLAVIGPETLRTSRFWNEWMAPQDMYGGLTAKLSTAGSSAWFFDVQRGRNQQAFGPSEYDFLTLIAPHLRRAIELNRIVAETRLFSSPLHDLPFGVLTVDAARRVITQNDAAEAILADKEAGLSVRNGQLVASDPAKNGQLQRLVASACRLRSVASEAAGGDLVFSAPDRDSVPLLAVSVSPASAGDSLALEPCAVVILRKIAQDVPTGFAEELRGLFGLTPKEALIAAGLTGGHALRDVANSAGIQFSTARTHLDRIFRKTGTRQQSQLVAVLKNLQFITRRR